MMVVVVLSRVPEALRGDLTRWLSEISANVFVGNVTAKIADHLWAKIEAGRGTGEALFVQEDHDTELGYSFKSLDSHYRLLDFDGLALVEKTRPWGQRAKAPKGWSKASAYHRRRRN